MSFAKIKLSFVVGDEVYENLTREGIIVLTTCCTDKMGTLRYLCLRETK